MSPYLYTLADIPLAWAAQRQWLRRFLVQFSGSVRDLLQIAPPISAASGRMPVCDVLQPDMLIGGAVSEHMGLRFIVVADLHPTPPSVDEDAVADTFPLRSFLARKWTLSLASWIRC